MDRISDTALYTCYTTKRGSLFITTENYAENIWSQIDVIWFGHWA